MRFEVLSTTHFFGELRNVGDVVRLSAAQASHAQVRDLLARDVIVLLPEQVSPALPVEPVPAAPPVLSSVDVAVEDEPVSSEIEDEQSPVEASAEFSAEQLDGLSFSELRELASERGISGRSREALTSQLLDLKV